MIVSRLWCNTVCMKDRVYHHGMVLHCTTARSLDVVIGSSETSRLYRAATVQALVVRKATSPSSKTEIQAVKHALAVMAATVLVTLAFRLSQTRVLHSSLAMQSVQ